MDPLDRFIASRNGSAEMSKESQAIKALAESVDRLAKAIEGFAPKRPTEDRIPETETGVNLIPEGLPRPNLRKKDE